MNKLFYIIIGLITLMIIGIFWYLLPNSNSNNDKVLYNDSSVSFPVAKGDNIIVDNFLNNDGVIKDINNTDLFFLGNTFTKNISGNSPPLYVVVYEASTGYFNIALLQKPFASSRVAAEDYLKNLLNLSENDLCTLSYSVSVPGYIDEEASGIDYRFSFCPGGIKL